MKDLKPEEMREMLRAIAVVEQTFIDAAFGIEPDKAEIEAVMDRLFGLWVAAFGEQGADRLLRELFQRVGVSVET